jgi:hypothetical protein
MPRLMRRLAPWLIAILILLAWTAVPDGVQASDPTPAPSIEVSPGGPRPGVGGEPIAGTAIPSEAPCVEDDPCWDCETMGNLICGPVPAPPAAEPQTPVLPDTAMSAP